MFLTDTLMVVLMVKVKDYDSLLKYLYGYSSIGQLSTIARCILCNMAIVIANRNDELHYHDIAIFITTQP